MHYANIDLLNMVAPRHQWARVWDEITTHWPQLNKRSRIAVVNQPRHEVIRITNQPLWPLRRAPISGWRRFKQAMRRYTLAELDNPVTRRAYQAELWSSMVAIPLPSLWRFVGRILVNDRWFERGTYEVDVISYTHDEIKFRRLGWLNEHGHIESFWIGYHADSDTVFLVR